MNKYPQQLTEALTQSFEHVKADMVKLGYIVSETAMRIWVSSDDLIVDLITEALKNTKYEIEIIQDPNIKVFETLEGEFVSDILVEAVELEN